MLRIITGRAGAGKTAKIIDELEERGLIGPADATGKRELFLDTL